jgi:tRNA-binding protein
MAAGGPKISLAALWRVGTHPQPPGPAMSTRMIEFDDFDRVEMRIGRVLAADPFPEARKPSYKLRIDFGPEIGERVSSAQLTVTYPDRASLVGRQVVAVVNFPPRRIAGFASEVLVLGAMGDDGNVWLLRPEPKAPIGSRIG